jgi:GNAT superfamily N-acetyltransferase
MPVTNPDPEDAGNPIVIRPFAASDTDFLARVAGRLRPGATASPRDPEVMTRYFAELAGSRLLSEPGAEAFVATIDGKPVGLAAVHPDADYFTGHPRAHVDVLVVAPEAEGRGVGRALLEHVETWGRGHRCREVVLDVFASNEDAMAFYERCGYRPDHVRMAKPLD